MAGWQVARYVAAQTDSVFLMLWASGSVLALEGNNLWRTGAKQEPNAWLNCCRRVQFRLRGSEYGLAEISQTVLPPPKVLDLGNIGAPLDAAVVLQLLQGGILLFYQVA